MWLLHTTTLHLHEFFGANTPPYAILSHTWGSGELVFQDVPLATPATAALHDLELSPALKGKPGFDKVARFCAFVKKWHDYAWVDTCCIDKRSSAELSEAVNSMYKWYRDAQICIVYLADVPPLQQDVTQDDGGYSTWEAAFRASRWFTRGWTLQELIASETRIFVARDWTELDIRQRSRGWHHDLLALVADITGIAEKVLRSRAALPHFCIAERMSWAARRQTTRAEDAAYSLLGLFAVNMPILYGEAGNAFTRLQEELLRRSPDESIFVWRNRSAVHRPHSGLLASAPADFADLPPLRLYRFDATYPFAMLNTGLLIMPWLLRSRDGPPPLRGGAGAGSGAERHHATRLAALRCQVAIKHGWMFVCVRVQRVDLQSCLVNGRMCDVYRRVDCHEWELVGAQELEGVECTVVLVQEDRHAELGGGVRVG